MELRFAYFETKLFKDGTEYTVLEYVFVFEAILPPKWKKIVLRLSSSKIYFPDEFISNTAWKVKFIASITVNTIFFDGDPFLLLRITLHQFVGIALQLILLLSPFPHHGWRCFPDCTRILSSCSIFRFIFLLTWWLSGYLSPWSGHVLYYEG